MKNIRNVVFAILVCIMLVLTSGVCVFATQAVPADTPAVRIYSINGDEAVIPETQLYSYKQVGWSDNLSDVQTTLYSVDGRTIDVFNGKVDAWLKVGWYYSPVVRIYSTNGAETVIPAEQLDVYKQVGWSDVLSDVRTTLYSADGRIINVINDNVDYYLKEGWMLSTAAKPEVEYDAILAGDLSSIAGTYGWESELENKLFWYYEDFEVRLEEIQKYPDGSYHLSMAYSSDGETEPCAYDGWYIYPVGVEVWWCGEFVPTDTTKVRAFTGNGDIMCPDCLDYRVSD